VRVAYPEFEHQPVVELFPELFSNRLPIPASVVSNLFGQTTLHMSAFLLNPGKPTPGMPLFTWVSAYFDGRLADQWRRSGRRELSHVSLVRHILGLPPSVAPQPIDLGPLPTVADLVFFAPVANFFQVDYHAFLPMAEKCRAKGLRVAWNFSEAEFARLDPSFASQIAGDTLFKGSLAEALQFAKMSRLVVSARSGFCELLSLCNCNYGIVHGPGCNGAERTYWCLDFFGSKPRFEYSWDEVVSFEVSDYC
jgi:hypothetical protein